MPFKPVAPFNGSHKYILCDSFGSGTVVWVVIPVLEEDIINTGLNSFVRVFTFFSSLRVYHLHYSHVQT